MNRTLWTVYSDRKPVAVVAADRSEDAWRIVEALADHDDLPGDRTRTDIIRCLPGQEARTVSLANSLGCADTFLACLGGGAFLTSIGGLSLDRIITSAAGALSAA